MRVAAYAMASSIARRRLASMIASGPTTAKRSWSTGGLVFMLAAIRLSESRLAAPPLYSIAVPKKTVTDASVSGFYWVAARNGDPVPGIHHNSEPFDRGDFLVIEDGSCRFIDMIRHLSLRDTGDRLGER